MTEPLTLHDAAYFVEDRINSTNVSIKDYITTDNILQNKSGVTLSTIQPNGNLVAFKKNDILVGNIRPYLKKIWFANRNGGCSPDVLAIRTKDGYNPNYIYYALFRDDFFIHMMKGSKGTKMPRGDKNHILKFHIPKFDITVQKNISSILSSCDSKIEINNRIIAELESMAKTLYDYWFVQYNFPDKKGKPYKTNGGKMECTEKLNREIPLGWCVKELREIFDNMNDTISAEDVKPKTPYTPIDFLPKNRMSFGGSDTFTEARTSLIKYCKYDILIGAMRVYFHRVCIAPSNGITRSTTIVLRPKRKEILPYLYQICNDDTLIQHASKISVGTQQPYVNWEKSLERYKIPFPADDVIILNYSKVIKPMIEKVINLELENQKLSELRDWLLPLLMNGQVKVK